MKLSEMLTAIREYPALKIQYEAMREQQASQERTAVQLSIAYNNLQIDNRHLSRKNKALEMLRGQKPLALCDRCPCFGSLFPPLAALTFAASSIICAFGLVSAAPRSPYRHLELCGIAIKMTGSFFSP